MVVTRAAEVASVEGDEGSRAGSSVTVKVAVTVEPKAVVVTEAGWRGVEAARVMVVTRAAEVGLWKVMRDPGREAR